MLFPKLCSWSARAGWGRVARVAEFHIWFVSCDGVLSIDPLIPLKDIMATATVPRSMLVTTIEEVATDYIGELMATAASTAHLRRLGIEDERIRADDVASVMQSLQGSLAVLVGDRTAGVAVTEIRRKIGMR